MKIIGFVNEKGGVGKSICTAMFATLLHKKGKFVGVIDLDHQKTLIKRREREGTDVFPLVEATSDNLQVTINMLEQQGVEYLVIDVPGNLTQEGVYQSYMAMDYMFLVTALTGEDMATTLEVIDKLNGIKQVRKEAGYDTGIYLLLNKVDVNGLEYKDLKDNHMENFPIPILKNVIPERVKVFRSSSTTDTSKDVLANIAMEECLDIIQG